MTQILKHLRNFRLISVATFYNLLNLHFISSQKLKMNPNKIRKSGSFNSNGSQNLNLVSNNHRLDFSEYLNKMNTYSFDKNTGQNLNSPEIINNWVIRSVEKAIDENAILECNQNSMCVKLSDSWLREKFKNVPEELYSGNPSSLLKTFKDGGESCLAVPEFEQTVILKSVLSPSETDSSTGQVIYWKYCEDLSNISCGTKILQNTTTITYKNQLTFDALGLKFPSQIRQNKLISGSDPILDMPFIAIPFQCHYSSDYQVGNNFIVQEQTTEFEFAGVGSFDVRVQLHNDDQFDTPLTGGLPVNQRLYGSAIITDEATHNADFMVLIKSLWMTQTEDPNDPTFYPIIVQGCSVNQEQHDFQYHLETNTGEKTMSKNIGEENHSHQVKFSMKGIQFTPRTSIESNDPIYSTSFFHAMVKICTKDDINCIQECNLEQGINDPNDPFSRTAKTIKSASNFIPETRIHGDRVVVGPPKNQALSRGISKSLTGGQLNFGFVHFFLDGEQKKEVFKDQLASGLLARRKRRELAATEPKFDNEDVLNLPSPDFETGLQIFEVIKNPNLEDEEHSTDEPVIINRYFTEAQRKQISTLGPIYWHRGYEEGSQALAPEDKVEVQLAIILSIVVIFVSLILILVVLYFYCRWKKSQEREKQTEQAIQSIFKGNIVAF